MNILNSLKILIIADISEDYLHIKKIFNEIEGNKQEIFWSKSLDKVPEIKFDVVFFTINDAESDLGEFGKINLLLGELPVIAITSNSDLNFTINLLENGAKDVLLKSSLSKLQLYKAIALACKKTNKPLVKKEKLSDQIAIPSNKSLSHYLFNESPEPKFLCKADDLSIEQISDKGAELLKITGEPIRYIYDLFKENKEEIVKNLTGSTSSKSYTFQTVLPHKTGSNKSIFLKVLAQKVELGEAALVLFSCVDISELEETKTSLIKNINRYQLVLQTTNNVTWEYNIESGELDWSENFSMLFGHDRESVKNIEKWASHIHPEDRDPILNSFKDSLEGKESKWQANYRFKKANGYYVSVFEQCIYIRDKEGKAINAFGTLKDVSRKKERQHQLSLMEKVVKSANDPILITEVDTVNPAGPRIIFANDAFLMQTGYSKEEILGKSPRLLQGEKSNKKELKKLKKALINGYPCRIETINYKKDGTEFWVEFSVVPISDEKGVITNWISIQRQITDVVKKRQLEGVFKKMNMAVGQPQDLEDRYSALLKVILKFTGLEVAEGWITNIDNSKLNKVTTCTNKTKFNDFSNVRASFDKAEIGLSLPGMAWQKGEIVYWENLENNTEFNGLEELQKYGLHSAIGIPIHMNKSLVGVITLFTKKKQFQLEPHLPFFESLSNRLGLELLRIKTENELKTIFEIIPNLLFVTDAKGVVVKGNMQASNTFECTETELKGISFRNMIPLADRLEFDNFLIKLEQSRMIDEIDIPILINDQIKWINLTATFLPSESFIYCVGKDISHQKNLEDLIRRTNEIVRIGTWEVTLSQNKMYWSPMTKVIHDLDEDYEPDLQSAINFYKEGYFRDLIQEKVKLAINGDINYFDIDTQLVTSKGRLIWVRVQAEAEWINGKLFRIYGSIQDIDERKKTEEEIMEAKMRYELASKASTIGVWDWDIEKNKVVWDETMQKLNGRNISNSLVSYDDWKIGLHPDDREKQHSLIEDALLGIRDFNTQFRIILPDSGEIRFIKAIAYVVRNNSGGPVRMVGINYDVTEEVEYKTELERVNREREEILGSITDGFFSVDKNWKVTYWNKAAESILKMPRKNIVGKNLWDVYYDTINLKFYSEFSISMKKGEERRFVEYYPTLDIWLECSAFPKENGIVVYLKDITERIKQLQKLAEITLLQEHVINSTEDLIWATDTQHRLIIANNAFINEILNVSGKKCELGDTLVNPNGNEIFNYWQDEFSQVLKGFQQNFTFEAKGNLINPKIFQVGMYPIIDNRSGITQITGVACFSRDITDKVKHIKAIEKQNEKLRDIAWKQSHVVRAPVARIMGLINLQQNMKYTGEELDEILTYIMDSSEELDKIIRDISNNTRD